MNLDFSKQKHIVKLSPRVYGDLEYKERRNWNSKNRIQRERANLMFERLFQCFYDLANSENFEYLEKRDDGKYQFTVTDGFAVVIIQLFKFVDGFIVVIQEILWPYKKDPNSWWYIVEDKPQNLIRLTESQLDKLIESYVKIFLQESNSKSKGKKGQKQVGDYTAIDGMWWDGLPHGLESFGSVQDVRMYDNDLFKGEQFETYGLFRQISSMKFFFAKIVPIKGSKDTKWVPIHIEEVPKIILDDLKTINPQGHEPYLPF